MAQNRISKKLILFSGLALVLSASVAHAAFEFKGPVSPASSVSTTSVPENFPSPVGEPTMPAQQVIPVTQETVISTPVPSVPSSVDVYNAPAPALPATDVSVVSEMPMDSGEVVSGFGSDLPLAIALQQVVPAGYQFSFGQNVNPGTNVSWDGGATWQTVLYDMLASAGLSYRVHNNVILVQQGQMAPPSISAPPAMQTKVVTPSPTEQTDVYAGDVSHNTNTEAVVLRRQKPSRILSGGADHDRTAGPSVPMYKNFPTSDGGLVSATTENNVVTNETSVSVVDETPAMDTSAPIALTPSSAGHDMSSAYVPPTVTTDGHPGLASDPILMTPTWHGVKSQTLRDVLKRWSDVAGVELYWSIDYDYRLSEDISLQGTYDEAVGQLLDLFAKVRPQPYGQLHQGNGDAPRVLVVKSYDLTN